MFTQSTGLISQVAQTGRMWLNSGAGGRAEILLRAAPNWLAFSKTIPRLSLSQTTHTLTRLPALGIQGFYLGQLSESLDLVNPQTASEAPTSLEIDPALGDENALDAFLLHAEQTGLELGASLLPAATGRGPDFVLQARNAPQVAGLYAMLPVAEENWPALPRAENEWDIQPLNSAQAESLADAGLFPSNLGRDALAWASLSGWAATGEVKGMDGQNRRWVYRFHKNPAQPVLFWQDPFGRGRRLFSAAIIRQTGLLGITLTGLNLGAMFGLEPATGSAQTLSPGNDAINDLSAQIHRYGGWTLQADPVPPDVIATLLAGPCDFCVDEITPLLATAALADGNTTQLAALYTHWQKEGLNFSRLTRGFNAELFPGLLEITRQHPPQAPEIMFKDEKIAIKAKFLLFNLRLGLPGLVFTRENELNQPASPEAASQDALLKARQKTDLASATLETVSRPSSSCIVLASRLPNGDYWLFLGNFGQEKQKIDFNLPQKAARCADAASNQDISAGLNHRGQKFSLTLDGLQGRNVIFSMD